MRKALCLLLCFGSACAKDLFIDKYPLYNLWDAKNSNELLDRCRYEYFEKHCDDFPALCYGFEVLNTNRDKINRVVNDFEGRLNSELELKLSDKQYTEEEYKELYRHKKIEKMEEDFKQVIASTPALEDDALKAQYWVFDHFSPCNLIDYSEVKYLGRYYGYEQFERQWYSSYNRGGRQWDIRDYYVFNERDELVKNIKALFPDDEAMRLFNRVFQWQYFLYDKFKHHGGSLSPRPYYLDWDLSGHSHFYFNSEGLVLYFGIYDLQANSTKITIPHKYIRFLFDLIQLKQND